MDQLSKTVLKQNGFKVGKPRKDGSVIATRDSVTAADIVRTRLEVRADGTSELTISAKSGKGKTLTMQPRTEAKAVSLALDAVALFAKQ